MALIFGSLALGQANSFAPSYSKAKQATKRIFALLDRKSKIDTYSDEGVKPVSAMAIKMPIEWVHTIIISIHGEIHVHVSTITL